MIVIFTLAVMSALLKGLDISCGCFTQDPAAGHIGWLKVVENTSLFALTLFLYYSDTAKFTLIEYLQKSGNGQHHSPQTKTTINP